MKAEELLEKCEEKINKPWYNWINLRFLWYGFWDEVGKIREEVFDGIEGFLDKDELKTFEKICDIRIDKIKTFLRDLVVMSISILTASLGIIVSILFEAGVIPKEGVSPMLQWFFTTGWSWLGIKMLSFLLPFFY